MLRNQAVVTILAGALCMSFGAYGVRLIQDADGFQILSYRGISHCFAVGLVACLTRRIGFGVFMRSFDRMDWFIGAAMAAAFCFYIFAILNTSVASALFILSVAPIFAALLSWILIKEAPTRSANIAIGLAMFGVAIMVGSGLGQGRTLGNIYAAISAIGFATMLVMARKTKKADVLGGNFLGALISMIIMATISFFFRDNSLTVTGKDLLIMLILGAFSIGLGIAFIAWAAPYLPASEVSLLVLIESVLSPIWVWLFLNEAMSLEEIIGGAFILGAVILLTVARRPKAV